MKFLQSLGSLVFLSKIYKFNNYRNNYRNTYHNNYYNNYRIKNFNFIIKNFITTLIFTITFFSLTTNINAKDTPKNDNWSAPKHQNALKKAKIVPDPIKEVKKESSFIRSKRLRDLNISPKDIKYKYLILKSPILEKTGDTYRPVRFMHYKHAVIIDDCSKCHHYAPKNPKKNSSIIEKEIAACSSCHREAFNSKKIGRVGLEAAYHLKQIGCLGCHKEMKKGPTSCTGCHNKNIKDHNKLVKFKNKVNEIEQVSQKCLSCHKNVSKDMLKTAHFLWQGPSPQALGHEKKIDLGKKNKSINNWFLNIASNEETCLNCHTSTLSKIEFNENTTKNIDCLLCHEQSGEYLHYRSANLKNINNKSQSFNFNNEDYNLEKMAKNIGRPNRKNCGYCHFNADYFKDNNALLKHGNLSNNLSYPKVSQDYHMGNLDFSCQQCHKTIKHRIAGLSSTSGVAEARVLCQDCHTEKPHGDALLDHHLNKHTDHIACMTCHIPIHSKDQNSLVWMDWSKAGNKNKSIAKDKNGMPAYDWKVGEIKWEKNIKPEYQWYSDKMQYQNLGNKITNLNSSIEINKPLGFKNDPKSKIYPFKIFESRLPFDSSNKYLLPNKLIGTNGFWNTFNFKQSLNLGAEAANLNFSGNFLFVNTKMYRVLNHEVMPKEKALSCVNCHESLAQNTCVQCHSNYSKKKTCDLCHQDNSYASYKHAGKGMKFKNLYHKGRDVLPFVKGSDYLDLKKLGYKGDPIIYGGRFKKLPINYGGSLIEYGRKK